MSLVQPKPGFIGRLLQHSRFVALFEISLIIAWAMWVGREYLNFSPLAWPSGGEFGMAIQPHYIWTQLRECGACIFWNGYYNGGSPAFVELHAAVLHPFVIISTLIWGGINGAKVILIASLALAGIAQWWLAKILGFNWLARLWSAGIAVTGGHLAGRMDIGVVGVVLSTAACSLVIPSLLKLSQSGRRQDTLLLAVVLALAIVSGQGYLQLGLALGLAPALLILLPPEIKEHRQIWKEIVLAGLLALLMTAVFLLPLIHFWPEFGKGLDPNFGATQPIEYIPLNFVIHDRPFYATGELGKIPYPYLNVNYIGWVPILLALVPLRLVRRNQLKLLSFFCSSIALIILAGSGLIFKLLLRLWPEFAAGVRHPNLIIGLSVPLILGLSAWGVDNLSRRNWLQIIFIPLGKLKYPRLMYLGSQALLLWILILALGSSYRFSQEWLYTISIDDQLLATVDSLKTADTQWVALPFGEHYWGPPATELGLKITNHFRPSFWKERPNPSYRLQATWDPTAEDDPHFYDQMADVNLLRFPNVHYAVIVTSDAQLVPCQAQAQAGNINVTCQHDQAGTLILQENYWSGWRVKRDGETVPLYEDIWLRTQAPAGKHTYEFRYRPWDAIAGLFISLMGIALVAYLWLRQFNRRAL